MTFRDDTRYIPIGILSSDDEARQKSAESGLRNTTKLTYDLPGRGYCGNVENRTIEVHRGCLWHCGRNIDKPGTMDPTKQVLILMKGHPGCAKSTVSRALARALRCPVIDKDDIRDFMLCWEAPDRPTPPAPTVLNTLSYDIMWRVVETQLQIGLSVVVDCPLARLSLFQVGSRQAEQYGCTLLIVECVAADLSEWKRRLEARARAALDPVFNDKTICMSCTESPMHSRTCVEKLADVASRDRVHEFCRESSEPQNQKGQHTDSVIDVERLTTRESNFSVEAIGSRDEKARTHWHKPSAWEDVERLLEAYAKCYEYDTGLTRKLLVDTTSLSTEAAVSGILEWIRNLDENSNELVSFLP